MLENTHTNAGATGDAGSIHGWERSPGGGNGKPTPVSILASKSCGQKSLVDCGPWCHKESDVTEATEHTHRDGILTCMHCAAPTYPQISLILSNDRLYRFGTVTLTTLAAHLLSPGKF